MPDALTVHVNRGELHSLDVPDSFEASESFDVVLVNHGEATHVHLHLSDALSELATIEAPNHHVDRNGERRVGVTLTEEGAARGTLKVVTAYGATTHYVDVRITEPAEPEETVQVSEELGKPQPRQTPAADASEFDIPLLPVSAVGGGALLLAVAAAVLFQQFVVMAAATVVAVVAIVAVVVAWAN